MHLTKELFVIPHEEKFILYAPLKRAVAEVNGDMVYLLKKLQAGENIGYFEKKLCRLKQIGIVTDGETPIAEYIPKKDYNPTAVTLIPSLDCNLRCIYCYANAGEMAGNPMDIEVAKSAIDFALKNAKDKGKKKTGLVFHGGGEPFLEGNMGMIKEATRYFKRRALQYDIEPEVLGTTNGVINPETLEWITSNFARLKIGRAHV